jgi:MoxR-like ATPase
MVNNNDDEGRVIDEGEIPVGDVGNELQRRSSELNAKLESIIIDLALSPAFYTFLIDKWHGMNMEVPLRGTNSFQYFQDFCVAFDLPFQSVEGAFLMYSPFTTHRGERIINARSLMQFRQTRHYGCFYNKDNKKECNDNACDQLQRTPSYNSCRRDMGNVWVQEEPGAPVRFSTSYLNTIFENVLDKNKIPLSKIIKVLYVNTNLTGVDIFERFRTDFHFQQEELDLIFENDMNRNGILPNPTSSYRDELIQKISLLRSKQPVHIKDIFINFGKRVSNAGILEDDAGKKHVFYSSRKNYGISQSNMKQFEKDFNDDFLIILLQVIDRIVLILPYWEYKAILNTCKVGWGTALSNKFRYSVVLHPSYSSWGGTPIPCGQYVLNIAEDKDEILEEVELDVDDEDASDPESDNVEVPVPEELAPESGFPSGNNEPLQITADLEEKINPFTLENSNLVFDDSALLVDRIDTAIQKGKHIILIGPPGTGKSKLAKSICETCWGKKRYVLATATSDWSTYDTIGGYRFHPDEMDKGKTGSLEFEPAIFLQSIADNKWLILDEINRTNIDQAFGALFSALAHDNSVLPFKEGPKYIRVVGKVGTEPEKDVYKDYRIPASWRIIATMNSFDKASLYSMSYAFMRRFAFIPVDVPKNISKDLIQQYAECWQMDPIDDSKAENVAELWKKMNAVRAIGPSIIQDVLSHVSAAEEAPYTSAIIMHVLPQFEGLSENDQEDFIKAIESLECVRRETIGEGRSGAQEVRQFAEQFLGLKKQGTV